MRRYRDDGWREIFSLILLIVVLIGGVIVYTSDNEQEVNDKIESCIEDGGTPIVVGHKYTEEFKGCANLERN